MRYQQIIAVAALALLGCKSSPTDSTGPFAYCTATASISVEVSVADSVTGNSIADAAHGVLQSSGSSDTLRYYPSPPILAGGNTLGTFSVIIDHAGYAQWRRDNVV